MKKKHLVRQFQIHMIVTVAIIAFLAIATYMWIEERRNEILPDKTSVYIDVTSSYADGSSETDTYSIDLDKINKSETYEKKNTVNVDETGNETDNETIQNDDEFILITLGENGKYETQIKLPSNNKNDNNHDDDGKIYLDKSKIQMGTSISVSSIRNAFSMLGEDEQTEYTRLGYLKFGLPAAYFVLGIILSCFIFYILRIKKPIALMEEATGKIAQNNLDFVIETKSKNELGRLCDSFESMRASLAANNKEMFKMMHEKRKLQSSVAHDLRNPIAIMKGYLEMLESDLQQSDISKEELGESVSTLSVTVERMEEYVKSVNTINQLEDVELCGQSVDIAECFENWKKDLVILGEKNNIIIDMKMQNQSHDEYKKYVIDVKAISRILENIISNSCRYAKEKIEVTLSAEKEAGFEFVICDDGPGYPDKLINNPDLYFYTTEQQDGHMGMALKICRILCAKHNGSIDIANSSAGGAVTKIYFKNLAES